MVASLVLACIFSQGRGIVTTLLNFFFYVQLYGILLLMVQSVALFVDDYYYRVYVLGGNIELICVGEYFKERICTERLVNNKDYAFRVRTYLFGFITIEKILNREYAIKAGWIVAGSDVQKTDDVVTDNPILLQISPTSNHIVKQPNCGSEVAVEVDEEAEEEVAVINDDVECNVEANHQDVSYNTIYNVKNDDDSINFSLSSKDIVIAKNHSKISRPIAAEACDDIQDDEALFREYQSYQSCNYDDYCPDDEILTFEEWKIERKKFKKNTRKSFIDAFQAFEEREMLQSSTKNAVFLSKQINPKVNPLLQTKRK